MKNANSSIIFIFIMKTENFDFEMMGRNELVQLLEHHNRLYWELNAPEISDAEYDKIVRALQKIDPENPLLSICRR